MPKTDIHQHMWTRPLLDALAERSELPFVRVENGLTILYLSGEPPYVLDLSGESSGRRRELVGRDGLDRALICLSSPLGIEGLARAEARELIDAYLDGALALGEPFGVWGAIPLEDADPDDVDRALERGCLGLSLPAGALARVADVEALRPVLARLERRGAPLLVHPGPGRGTLRSGPRREWALSDPLWWPALTDYLAGMQAAWLAFALAGRPSHPRLRVVFAMLAGLAPLHTERLRSRGGPSLGAHDPLTFYDTSSYGPEAIAALAARVGREQLVYGSDRPVVEPSATHAAPLDREALAAAGGRVLEPSSRMAPRAPAAQLAGSLR
jgi:6-methylsalicylate decarboxylase